MTKGKRRLVLCLLNMATQRFADQEFDRWEKEFDAVWPYTIHVDDSNSEYGVEVHLIMDGVQRSRNISAAKERGAPALIVRKIQNATTTREEAIAALIASVKGDTGFVLLVPKTAVMTGELQHDIIWFSLAEEE